VRSPRLTVTTRIDHLLSAPLFLSPQLVGDRIFFISNLSGRLTKADSDELVADLRAAGKDVEYLVFDDEGHDLTRRATKARCQAITTFFEQHLRP
jgi:hypothetical protein